MNKEFISYEQALELKELGFDKECIMKWVWSPFNKEHYLTNEWLPTTEKIVSAPTFSQAFRWFREKHLLLGYTTTGFCPFKDKPKSKSGFRGFICGIDIRSLSSSDNFFKEIQTNCYETYEEAELACLKKLIEIVKQPKKD